MAYNIPTDFARELAGPDALFWDDHQQRAGAHSSNIPNSTQSDAHIAFSLACDQTGTHKDHQTKTSATDLGRLDYEDIRRHSLGGFYTREEFEKISSDRRQDEETKHHETEAEDNVDSAEEIEDVEDDPPSGLWKVYAVSPRILGKLSMEGFATNSNGQALATTDVFDSRAFQRAIQHHYNEILHEALLKTRTQQKVKQCANMVAGLEYDEKHAGSGRPAMMCWTCERPRHPTKDCHPKMVAQARGLKSLQTALQNRIGSADAEAINKASTHLQDDIHHFRTTARAARDWRGEDQAQNPHYDRLEDYIDRYIHRHEEEGYGEYLMRGGWLRKESEVGHSVRDGAISRKKLEAEERRKKKLADRERRQQQDRAAELDGRKEEVNKEKAEREEIKKKDAEKREKERIAWTRKDMFKSDTELTPEYLAWMYRFGTLPDEDRYFGPFKHLSYKGKHGHERDWEAEGYFDMEEGPWSIK